MTFYLNIKDIVPHNSEFISHNSHLCLRIDSEKKVRIQFNSITKTLLDKLKL